MVGQSKNINKSVSTQYKKHYKSIQKLNKNK